MLTFADPELAVTASVGLATGLIADGETGPGAFVDLPELMADADRALYRAKHDGRNRVDTADPRRDPAPPPTPRLLPAR